MKNESFKVGDEVFVKRRLISRIETIERETKTRFHTKYTSFYKKDNSIADEPFCDSVVKATQEHFEMLEKSKFASRLGVFDFNTLNLDTLKEINELIKSKEEVIK